VLINGKAHLSNLKFNAVGNLVGGNFANGSQLKRSYDTSGNPSGTELASYVLDTAGNITNINTVPNPAIPSQAISIAYNDEMTPRVQDWRDTLQQTATTTGSWQRFLYDVNGNRKSKQNYIPSNYTYVQDDYSTNL
jgi:hypothetical protein